VPVFTTDSQGTVHTVNTSAAALLRMPAGRLIRKPILAFIAYSDRPQVRRLLSRAVADHADFRTTATLTPRDADPVLAQLVVTAADPASGRTELTWIVNVPMTAADSLTDNAESVRPLVDLTALPLRLRDAREIIQRIADICSEAFGRGVEVTVTTGEPAAPTLLASTSALGQRVDGAQVIAEEGPSQQAWESKSVVVTDDIRHDHRWPRLARRLTGVAVDGTLAIPIPAAEGTLGVLNLSRSSCS
jgi:GAF domain-containing protein